MAEVERPRVTKEIERNRLATEVAEKVSEYLSEIPKYYILTTNAIKQDLNLDGTSSHLIGSVLRAHGYIKYNTIVWFHPAARKEVD